MKKLKRIGIIFLSFVLFFSSLSLYPAFTSAEVNAPPEIIEEVEHIKEITDIPIEDYNLDGFEEEFESLVNDPVFLAMEEHLVLTNQDANLEELEVQGQWIPIAAAAIRFLTKTVGKKGMDKAWSLARPHVKKWLNAPKKYILEGIGSGGRIIQVRNKSNGSVVFRLDYFPIKHGGPYVLHYHVPPNLKTHHVIKF